MNNTAASSTESLTREPGESIEDFAKRVTERNKRYSKEARFEQDMQSEEGQKATPAERAQKLASLTLSEDAARREIVADFVGRVLLQDADMVRRMIVPEIKPATKGHWQKVLDRIKEFLNIAKGTEMEEPLSQTYQVLKEAIEYQKDKTIESSREFEKGQSYDEESVNRVFNEELQKQINNPESMSGHVYRLGKPSEKLLATGFPADQVIEMSASHLKKKTESPQHPFPLEAMTDLVKALRNPIAVFAYGKDGSKAQNAIVEMKYKGDNFLIGVHFDQGEGKAIASIRGIFPKYNTEWLSWIERGKDENNYMLGVDKAKVLSVIDEMKALFADEKKTEEYLSHHLTGRVDLTKIDFDHIAKVVKDFGTTNKNEIILDEIKNNSVKFSISDSDKVVKAKPWESDAVTDNEVMEQNSAEVSSARYSLVKKDDIENASESYFHAYYEGKGDSRFAPVKKQETPITRNELETANLMIREMADIMLPYLNQEQDGKRYLPEEVYGKGVHGQTIMENGSYGKTMENTTICLRTLSYNDFVDNVKKKLGRPLTQTESFLASQMVYEIAKDPQCLYCYVSLDRKAYDDFLLRYIDERDNVLGKFDSLPEGKKKFGRKKPNEALPELYQEFLNGRKDTEPMRNRFNMWINAYANGEAMVKPEDLVTAESRQTVRTGEDKGLMQQMKDAEQYAQSASWSKKNIDYRSYTGELLKLSKGWIDKLTSEYGLRFYSFSEYTPAFIVENMQMVRDAALRGLKGLAYTKELDFAKIFAPTGLNINCSMYGRRDAEGNIVADTRQGADWNEVKELREKHPNIGGVFVATDDAMVEWALAQNFIDVVIPFHIVRTGQEIADFYGWTNYSKDQADKNEKGHTKYISPAEHHNDKATFLELCQKEGYTPRFSQWIDNPNYMKLVNETRRSVDETGQIKPIFNLDAAKESFAEFVDKGGYYGGWWEVDDAGYHDAVNTVVDDVKAGKKANEVEYGRQDMPVNTDKMMAAARKHRQHGNTPLSLGQRNSIASSAEPLTREPGESIEDFARRVTERNERNEDYLAAVEKGDTKTTERLVQDAAKEAMPETKVVDKNGMPLKVYHGTNHYGFTVFDTSLKRNKWNMGSHFGSEDAAAEFTDEKTRKVITKMGTYSVYLNIKNPWETSDWYFKGDPSVLTDVLKLVNENGTNEVRQMWNELYNMVPHLKKRFSEEDILNNEQGDFNYEMVHEWKDSQHESFYDKVREIVEACGYDGIKYYNGTEGEGGYSWIALHPEQIKSAEAVTYDNNGKVIPLSERFNEEKKDIRYSVSAFYSNAAKAVEDIKQTKGTGEQWLAMLKKNGGLKAEEDKWIGLSEWLKDKKSVTKDEIQKFIAENDVKVEEVHYADIRDVNLNNVYDALDAMQPEWKNAVARAKDEVGDTWRLYVRASEIMSEKYGDKFDSAIDIRDNGTLRIKPGMTKQFAEMVGVEIPTTTNATRLKYTTEGLTNKREIALTVPNIESYNESDKVHFGDAGNGRAVAWLRFGDATDADGNKVLVIDEIQSKRHQDGREKGYQGDASKQYKVGEYETKTDKFGEYKEAVVYDADGNRAGTMVADESGYTLDTGSKKLTGKTEAEVINETFDSNNAVPDAPFQKNWHELAMKRALRYAAENGYDKVAWTTGTQQAERYELRKQLDSIEYFRNEDGTYFAFYILKGRKDGNTVGTKLTEKELVENFGKDIADKIISGEKSREREVKSLSGKSSRILSILEGDNLVIGGEGMKGFYDQMLPRYMDKYGKKWGVSTHDIELNLPNEADQVMHAVDVNDAMRESVMQGQPRFSISGKKKDVHLEDSEKNTKFAESEVKSFEEDGRQFLHQRLPQEKSGSINGILAQATGLLARGNYSRTSSQEETARRNAAEKSVEKLAKSTGVWLGENLDDESEARFGEKINSGGESYVYLVDANTVQKNRSTVGFVQLEHAFNSVFIHNALFPSSAYKVNGVGRSYDEFTIQLEQPYVKGEHPEQREIDAYMQSIGFEKNPYSKSNTSYYNKDLDITVEDLKPANVIKTGETLTIIDDDCYFGHSPLDRKSTTTSKTERKEKAGENGYPVLYSISANSISQQVRDLRDEVRNMPVVTDEALKKIQEITRMELTQGGAAIVGKRDINAILSRTRQTALAAMFAPKNEALKRRLDSMLEEVRDICVGADLKAETQELIKLLNTQTHGKNQKGVTVAKNVDANTADIMEQIQSTFKSYLTVEKDAEIRAKGREIRQAKEDLDALRGNGADQADIDAKMAEVATLEAEQNALKAEREQMRADQVNDSRQKIEADQRDMEAQLDEMVRDGITPSREFLNKYDSIPLRMKMIEMREAQIEYEHKSGAIQNLRIYPSPLFWQILSFLLMP